MLSRNQIKEIRSLKQKKFRQKYDKFVVEGHKTAIEFIKSGTYKIESVFAIESWSDQYHHLIGKESGILHTITRKEMERISLLTTPTDVLMVCNRKAEVVKLPLKEYATSFYLDNIQDPGNLGTIIRLCDWFGMKRLFLSPDTVDEYNPKVIQATMGSICNIEIIRISLETLKEGVKHQFIGTDMTGIPIHKYNWPSEGIIILGNEGRGISNENLKLLDDRISITGASRKIAESLNVATVASILAYLVYNDHSK